MLFLKVIWNFIISKFLLIGMRFEYFLYKKSIHLSIIKTLKTYINIFQYDNKNDAYFMTSERKYVNIIEEKLEKNEEFKKLFSNYLSYYINICNSFVPLFYDYLVKGINKDFRNNKYIGDIINSILTKTCSLKRNKLIDKCIVDKLRKLTFKNTDKNIEENLRRFILDSLIQFAKLEFGKMSEIEFNLNNIDELNKDELISIIFSLQVYQPIYIIKSIVSQEKSKHNQMYKKISNSMLHVLRNKFGMDLDIREMPDYELLDLIMKI